LALIARGCSVTALADIVMGGLERNIYHLHHRVSGMSSASLKKVIRDCTESKSAGSGAAADLVRSDQVR
jgi:hypothetical protein